MQAAQLGITELAQKEGTLRLSLPKPDFARVAAVCGLEKYKGRLLFNAGEKPYLGPPPKKRGQRAKAGRDRFAGFRRSRGHPAGKPLTPGLSHPFPAAAEDAQILS